MRSTDVGALVAKSEGVVNGLLRLDINGGEEMLENMKKLCLLSVVAFATLSVVGCPQPRSNSVSSPPTLQLQPGVQNGVVVLTTYSGYFAEYRQKQTSAQCSPMPGCLFASGPPNPLGLGGPAPASKPISLLDQIPSPIGDLTTPGDTMPVLPSTLTAILQAEFANLLKQVPSQQAAQVQGVTLIFAACSVSTSVLWSGNQLNAQHPGSVCLSPLIIKKIFLDLSNGSMPAESISAQSVIKLLIARGSTDPLGYNGDSMTLIRSWVAQQSTPQQFTQQDIQAMAGAVDSSMEQLGDTVVPMFVNCMDYLLAREIAKLYLPNATEGQIGQAAWALVNKPGAQGTLQPLSVTIQSAVSVTNAAQWGVGSLGDGQVVLNAITAIMGQS